MQLGVMDKQKKLNERVKVFRIYHRKHLPKTDQKEEKFLYVCRACLGPSDNYFPIFEDIPQANTNIATMLNECSLEVDQNDEFPQVFCESCFATLQTVHSFIHTFKTSQVLLLQQSPIHIENSGSKLVEENFGNINYQNEEENDEDSPEDQNILIEQSIKLTQQYKLHKLDVENCIDESESDDDPKIDNQCRSNKIAVKQELMSVDSVLKTQTPKSVKLTCPLCPEIFNTYYSLRNHLTEHNSEIICTACFVKFSNPDSYLKHQRNQQFLCTICDKSFYRCDTFSKHMLTHNHSSPQYTCPVENCLKSFAVKQSLKSHYETMHTEKCNFLCNVCGISFKNYGILRYHMKKHTGPSHLCPHCGRRFMQAVHLTYHMWRHTGVKPYKCLKCEKRFVSRKILLNHLKNCGR